MRKGSHHTEETREKLRQLSSGVVRSSGYKQMMSESTKRHWDSPDGMLRRERYSEMLNGKGHPMYGKKHAEPSRDKMRQAKLGGSLTEDHKAKIGLASKRIGISEETRVKMGESLSVTRRKQWQDPEYVLKQIEARHVKPNKAEQALECILCEHGVAFQYNGDGRLGVVVAGLVPDYVGVNGKKQILELFGEYWHRLEGNKWHQSERGRIEAYKSAGWDCLVVWESELADEAKLVDKLRKFVGGY